MTPPRFPIVVGFVILGAVGVGALLLDDALGGGWAGDVVAVAIVLGCIALLLAATVRFLNVDEDLPLEGTGPARRRAPGRRRRLRR